ncbi:MAG: hypothetical protein US69_C0022G0005 [candidate division TM6 bacterium GW2011_GWF2_38_10]|nr:MAG: hypothetical protein US69_C0022G0005 [candidate division TM6 bacterium GW2011_GWF2_38_10]
MRLQRETREIFMIHVAKAKPALRSFIFFLGICCLLCSTKLHGQNFDDFSDFDISLDDIMAYEETMPTKTLPKEEQNFINAMTAAEIVAADSLWSNTKAPAGRDILYLLPYKISALERGGIAWNLFFNMTNDMNVGARNLINKDAINLDDLAAFLPALPTGTLNKDLGEPELASLLALFSNITLQERKLGGMIQCGFSKGPFMFQLQTSLHMAERNFWLSPQERARISAILKNDSGNFNEDELIRFRYGAGDTRIKIGLNTLNKTNFQIDVGFESIIPTSKFTYSGHYKTLKNKEIVSIESLGDNFFNVLRGVRDYLINPRMGNNGHFGLGFYLETKAHIFKGLADVWTRFSYDKLLPGEEDRLLMYKKTAHSQGLLDYYNENINGNPNPKAELLEFYKKSSSFITQYLFPSSFLTTVYPGGVFNAVLALSTDIYKTKWSLGYDFYLQQEEHIKKLHNTNTTLDELRLEDAQSPRAYQHKFFIESLYIKSFKRCNMGFGIGGDTTLSSNGIGKDWTAYLKVTASF